MAPIPRRERDAHRPSPDDASDSSSEQAKTRAPNGGDEATDAALVDDPPNRWVKI